MSARELDGLLQPSLAGEGPRQPIYSKRAGFLVAFFGGVYATLTMNAMNSARLGRLRRDGVLYLAAAVLWSAALVWVGSVGFAEDAPRWLQVFGDTGRTVRYAGRLLAMLLFGGVFLMHRPYYTAQDLGASDPPNPWKAGILASLLAMAVTVAMVVLGRSLA